MESRSIGRLVDSSGNQLDLSHVGGAGQPSAGHETGGVTSTGFLLPPYVTRLENHDNQGTVMSHYTKSLFNL
jgi:hypothetical protein